MASAVYPQNSILNVGPWISHRSHFEFVACSPCSTVHTYCITNFRVYSTSYSTGRRPVFYSAVLHESTVHRPQCHFPCHCHCHWHWHVVDRYCSSLQCTETLALSLYRTVQHYVIFMLNYTVEYRSTTVRFVWVPLWLLACLLHVPFADWIQLACPCRFTLLQYSTVQYSTRLHLHLLIPSYCTTLCCACSSNLLMCKHTSCLSRTLFVSLIAIFPFSLRSASFTLQQSASVLCSNINRWRARIVPRLS